MAHKWCVRRLEMPLWLKYKCTALLVTRPEVPKNFHLRQLINPCMFQITLVTVISVWLEETSVLANSILSRRERFLHEGILE